MYILKISHILLSLPKTLYFNFKYFKFKDAVKLPVLVSHRTFLMKTQGNIQIENPKMFGIRIGFGDVGIFDKQKSRGIWQVQGQVTFKGTANIGHGAKISVGPNGKLQFGDNFCITAESSIVCSMEIVFGDNVLMSWENLVMDTDFHTIINKENRKLNPDAKIVVGNHVWFGCRCTMLKGSCIADNSVLAANSVLSAVFDESNTVIGGNPTRVLRRNINWIK